MTKSKTKKLIDLRSDTVTLPTKEMLEAIQNAKLGDDVYGEDPTVNQLEEMAAKKVGKEAALLVPSGTMANLVSVIANTHRGESAIFEASAHLYYYESGGISAIAGVLPLPIKGKMGVMDPQDIEVAIRPNRINSAETTLICIENTHNRAGGTIISPTNMEAINKVAKNNGLRLYMDGARIFNAAVALKIDVKKFTQHVDNLMFCFSKGLSCPIGSIIVGNELFIQKAKKVRKIIGGGMRQAGIIAAPAIIALEKMINRLEDDHKNARFLAEGIIEIEGINIDMHTVQTNIILLDVSGLKVEAKLFVKILKENGILTLNIGKKMVRLVTHRGIMEEDIEKTLIAIEETVKDLRH